MDEITFNQFFFYRFIPEIITKYIWINLTFTYF